MDIKITDITDLIKVFEEASVSKMTFTHEGTSLELEKPIAGERCVNVNTSGGALGGEIKEPSGVNVTPPEAEGTPVNAPLAGVFYRAPKPDGEPFVKKGGIVKKGEVVGIIEAMKMMNEITAPVSGRVECVNVGNGEFVQYGDELMRVVEE